MQEQFLITAKLKQDINGFQRSLALAESENISTKELLNKYETIISAKEQEEKADKEKIEKTEEEYKKKESMLKGETNRLREECHDLRERIGIMQQREKDSINIIRAQKRQIEDLKVLETDVDARTMEYKKLVV